MSIYEQRLARVKMLQLDRLIQILQDFEPSNVVIKEKIVGTKKVLRVKFTALEDLSLLEFEGNNQ